MNKLFHTFLLMTLISFGTSYGATPKKAVFAGGCFWCMEPPFDAYLKKGVISVLSGYTGGKKETATYTQVSEGLSGHKEVIEVQYDPEKISYAKLLEIFWANIDPLDAEGQFCDKGDQYQSAVYYNDDQEKILIENSLKEVQKKLPGKIIRTKVLKATPFYAAEEYHQDYYLKNPVRYKFYRYNCGRDQRLKEVWKK